MSVTLINRMLTNRLAAVLAVATISVAVFTTACGDDATASPAPEPTPTTPPQVTPTPAPQPQTPEEFVAELNAALKRGDLDFIAKHIPSGGISVGTWRSEGSEVTAAQAREFIEWFITHGNPDESDEFGSGDVQIYAISNGDRLVIILTGIVDPPPFLQMETGRASMALFYEQNGEEFVMDYVVAAYVLGEEFLTPDSEAKGHFPEWERYS